MALKKKIDKEAFDKLSADLKKEYTKDGDNYVLDVEASDDDDDDNDPERDPVALRRARDREKADAKAARKELKAATDRLAALEANRDPKDRDIAKLESEWKEKLETEKADGAEKLTKARNRVAESLVSSTVNAMATEISTMPKIMAKELRDRFAVEFDDDDEPTLIIKNSKGKPSEMTLDQLKKEIVANKEYAPILIGSKASGGGAPRQATEQRPGSAGASAEKPTDLSKLSGKDLAAHLRAQKESTDAQ